MNQTEAYVCVCVCVASLVMGFPGSQRGVPRKSKLHCPGSSFSSQIRQLKAHTTNGFCGSDGKSGGGGGEGGGGGDVSHPPTHTPHTTTINSGPSRPLPLVQRLTNLLRRISTRASDQYALLVQIEARIASWVPFTLLQAFQIQKQAYEGCQVSKDRRRKRWLASQHAEPQKPLMDRTRTAHI